MLHKKEACDDVFKLLRSPGIDFASLCSMSGRYENPIPTRFLAPIDCSKIPKPEFVNVLRSMAGRNDT
jgi:hypothetical protein